MGLILNGPIHGIMDFQDIPRRVSYGRTQKNVGLLPGLEFCNGIANDPDMGYIVMYCTHHLSRSFQMNKNEVWIESYDPSDSDGWRKWDIRPKFVWREDGEPIPGKSDFGGGKDVFTFSPDIYTILNRIVCDWPGTQKIYVMVSKPKHIG